MVLYGVVWYSRRKVQCSFAFRNKINFSAITWITRNQYPNLSVNVKYANSNNSTKKATKRANNRASERVRGTEEVKNCVHTTVFGLDKHYFVFALPIYYSFLLLLLIWIEKYRSAMCNTHFENLLTFILTLLVENEIKVLGNDLFNIILLLLLSCTLHIFNV